MRDIPRTLPDKDKFAFKRLTVDDDTDLGGGKDLLVIVDTDKDITLTLASRGDSGQTVIIKNKTDFDVTVEGTIDDDDDGLVLTEQYESVGLYRDEDSEWWIVMSYKPWPVNSEGGVDKVATSDEGLKDISEQILEALEKIEYHLYLSTDTYLGKEDRI